MINTRQQQQQQAAPLPPHTPPHAMTSSATAPFGRMGGGAVSLNAININGGPPSISSVGGANGGVVGGGMSPLSGVGSNPGGGGTLNSRLAAANEQTWLKLGTMNEALNETDRAMECYENVLKHNSRNTKALAYIAFIFRQREQYPKAAEYFQRILNIDITNGEIWGALGHVHLLQDELQKAYAAYQQALYHLANPKDPNLWYGIGILYERFGSNEHAEEAFMAVLKMDPEFEKASEIHYRLGMLYKQQPTKLAQALESFQQVCTKPPHPLSKVDIWTHIGNVYELQKEFEMAKDSYEHALKENPSSPKQIQQLMVLLGWLNHYAFSKTDEAIDLLTKATQQESNDSQSSGQAYYLLGRCHMSQMKYRKAYQAYQQAVYQDAKSPSYWCSIGILYYRISQYRDALDAYTKSIKLGPALSEVWYNLCTLYEACNQIPDAIDACRRAAEIDPNSKHIHQRLAMLKSGEKRESLEENNKPPLVIEPVFNICCAHNASTKSVTRTTSSTNSTTTTSTNASSASANATGGIPSTPTNSSSATSTSASFSLKRDEEENIDITETKALHPVEVPELPASEHTTNEETAPSPSTIPNHQQQQQNANSPPPPQILPGNTPPGTLSNNSNGNNSQQSQQPIPPITTTNPTTTTTTTGNSPDDLSRKRQHHGTAKHTSKRSKVQGDL
ncbi:general transcriptional repressor [Pelomyxa schiedti]|nr:general transcriptional repressor [Pelomyxa schiedti]